MESGEGAMVGSRLWTMLVSSYVPGTLELMGSPWPDVLKMMYCALLWVAQVGPDGAVWASALRGSRRNDAGKPVASARRPMQPAPKSVDIRASRRETLIEKSFLTSRWRRTSEPYRPRQRSIAAPGWRWCRSAPWRIGSAASGVPTLARCVDPAS